MFLIRPVALRDVDGLLALSHLTGFGLTTLPRDRAMLERRVRESLRSFEKVDVDAPSGELYLLVLEDLESGRVVGTSGVVPKVGGYQPFYAFKIKKSVIRSKMLGVRKQIQTLHLVMEHNGPCEIGSLFLHPAFRKGGNGRALALSRFLLMADHPASFDPVVIAEMRGVIDQMGHSAFWDAVGKHFFDLELPKADYLSIVNKEFIGDLMPKHPLYIPLLPVEAQAVIGQVHDETRPARGILESEGFGFSGMVDIFEAGPIMRCARDQIRTVRESRRATVAELGGSDAGEGEKKHLVSNARRDIRVCQAAVAFVGQEQVRLAEDVAAALEVKVGDAVRYVMMRAEQTVQG